MIDSFVIAIGFGLSLALVYVAYRITHEAKLLTTGSLSIQEDIARDGVITLTDLTSFSISGKGDRYLRVSNFNSFDVQRFDKWLSKYEVAYSKDELQREILLSYKRTLIIERCVYQFEAIARHRAYLPEQELYKFKNNFRKQLRIRMAERDIFSDIDKLDATYQMLYAVKYSEELIDRLQDKRVSQFVSEISSLYSTLLRFFMFTFSKRYAENEYDMAFGWQRYELPPYTFSIKEDRKGIEEVIVG